MTSETDETATLRAELTTARGEEWKAKQKAIDLHAQLTRAKSSLKAALDIIEKQAAEVVRLRGFTDSNEDALWAVRTELKRVKAEADRG